MIFFPLVKLNFIKINQHLLFHLISNLVFVYKKQFCVVVLCPISLMSDIVFNHHKIVANPFPYWENTMFVSHFASLK